MKNQDRIDQTPVQVTQKELVGKTFAAKLRVKISTGQKKNSLAKTFERARLEYRFKANNQVLYQVSVDGMVNKLAFTWHLKGDSLAFERMENGQTKTNRYFIQRTRSGLILDSDEYRAYLTLK